MWLFDVGAHYAPQDFRRHSIGVIDPKDHGHDERNRDVRPKVRMRVRVRNVRQLRARYTRPPYTAIVLVIELSELTVLSQQSQ